MKLYHFTADRFLLGIQRTGITDGALPLLEKTKTILQSGCQWLTSEPDYDKQSWATKGLIDYDRTEARLQVSIPKSHRDELFKAKEYALRLSETARKIITDWEGSEHWYLFFGRIPPGWIRRIDYKDIPF